MYTNSYKYISSDNSQLPDLVNNSSPEIQAIEEIKNFLKRSAEEFEAKQLLKKIKLVSSPDVSNLAYPTDTNEVSEIIEKKIEFLYTQKSSIKDDKFQKIIEELFPYESIDKEMIIENEICDPVILSSNVDQETHLQSSPPTDILSLAWSIAVLSSDNNLEFEGRENTISSDLTSDISSSHPTREINQKILEPMKRSWKNPEYRKMRAEAVKRSWEEAESRKKKRSEASKRYWEDQAYRRKISEARKGKRHSEETKRKMSEARKGRRLTQETRQKLSEARKGKRHSEETKRKISEAYKERRLTQETRQKLSEAFITETFVVKKPTKTYERLKKTSLQKS